MNDLEKGALDALGKVSMCLDSPGKRFRRDLHQQAEREPDKNLTRHQALFLWILIYRYRRQLRGDHRYELLKHGIYVQQTGLLPDFYADYQFRGPKGKSVRMLAIPKAVVAKKSRLELELERSGGRLKL